ncbi:MAG TPA: ornithine carbamoyltransferase [Candidatus Thermoplasmatota archaeon]|jgi:ornithine carbamoyltransferase|nr:ornithine carbamoyltransferase [Candidatus Thermoplasmatota archaeon]
MQHLLGMLDTKGQLDGLLREAAELKAQFKAGKGPQPLARRQLAMIFEKSSTRTRVSFEVGIHLLGGQALFLSPNEIQMGRGETIEDTAKVLSRYVDVIMYRCFQHENVIELARHATVPVINGLSDKEHPCQILADWLTIQERKGGLRGLQFVYVGDGNNMCRSYLLGGALAGMHTRVCTPRKYHPGEDYLELAQEEAKATGARIAWTDDIAGATKGADVVATDTWVSMGDEKDKEQRVQDFQGYTIDDAAMKRAKPDAIFLHCLPAYYGKEVTKQVAHGPQSAIWDEAENRMWAQMALMVRLLRERGRA